jgi:hypothetical protein
MSLTLLHRLPRTAACSTPAFFVVASARTFLTSSSSPSCSRTSIYLYTTPFPTQPILHLLQKRTTFNYPTPRRILHNLPPLTIMSPSKSQQQQKQQPPPQQKTQGKDKDDLQTSQANEAKHQPDGVEEVNQDSTEPSQELTIAFFKADKIPQESKEEMGSYEGQPLTLPFLLVQFSLSQDPLPSCSTLLYSPPSPSLMTDVVHNLFEPMLPEHLTLKILPYDVVNARAYPTEAELANIDAIVISGSFEDEAHEDTVMILRLAGFLIGIRDKSVPLRPLCRPFPLGAVPLVDSETQRWSADLSWINCSIPFPSWPRIRIIGICFGLQILARAFGPAKITENDKGWSVSTFSFPLPYSSLALLAASDQEADQCLSTSHRFCVFKLGDLGRSDQPRWT